MLPDRVSNPGPLTYESGALPIALRSPASDMVNSHKFSEKNCKILKTKLVRSIFIYLEFQKKRVVSQH